MNDSFERLALNSPISMALSGTKQSPIMQFTQADSDGQKFNHSLKNNEENLLSSNTVKSSMIETPNQNNNNTNSANNENHLAAGASSPHLSSSSSVSSHAQISDDCDTVAQAAQLSSPSSPQSSYNSSFGSNSGKKLVNNSNTSITSLVPGGVVTTQNISTVIKPKSNNNSLQFVKIQTPELSKKAVEQIRIAEETKISKDKIKEVEEEWQNNLLNWKSKRRQQFSHTVKDEPSNLYESDNGSGRKIKTFAEMIEQRAKSGNRLGFHLQRYISADDEDEASFVNIGDSNDNDNKDYAAETDQMKNPADSDYEAHSNTSSDFNQVPSKTPSPSETPFDIPSQNGNGDTINPPGPRLIKRNSNLSADHDFDERDHHSISLVESSGTDQLNSTLKQDIGGSPYVPAKNELSERCPQPAISTATKDVSAIEGEDESDNSGFDEEEEEQKQLQRIAFEAKLKAFEKLTKPTIHTPKSTPTRAPKPPIPTPNTTRSLTQSRTNYVHPPTTQNSPLNQDKQQMEHPRQTIQPSIDPPKHVSPGEELSIQAPKQKPTRLVKPPIPLPIESYGQALSSHPNIPTSPSGALNRGVTVHEHQIQRSLPLPDPPKNIAPPQAAKPPIEHLHDTPNMQPTTNHTHQDSVAQRHRNLSNQPLPDLPRKSNKDDNKDRTVLSVSGKKRCSSCKEELGRGAAAFVVESLSLVYHTNCFRCSVCHVNLSNGFRGVDVRVHAGALHCQNCYSKDGLNYSRV